MTAIVPQITTISNSKFLEGIFGDCFNAAHVTGFVEPPDELEKLGKRHFWGGDAFYRNPLEDSTFNNFFVISTFHADADGSHRRRKNNFAASFCMMIDDVGSGPGAKISEALMELTGPEPSWILETSKDNHQYGYIFSAPVMDRHKIEALLKGFVKLGLVDGDGDPGMLGCTRYARLPVGTNNKSKYSEPFPHQLRSWKPGLTYDIDALALGFGIDLKAHYTSDDGAYYGEAKPTDQDMIYQSLHRMGLIKTAIRPGVYDITCPWHKGHTETLDNGTAYLAPMGLKCHHGSCASRKGRDLMNWLHGADPVYATACAAKMPFQPIEKGSEKPQDARSDDIEAMIDRIDPNVPSSADGAYRALAVQYVNFSPAERDFWRDKIKVAAATTAATAKAQLKYIRNLILQENKENGTIVEPQWSDFVEDRLIGTLDNFRAICEFHGIEMKFNQMSHAIDCSIPKKEFKDEDVDNLNLSHLKDLVQKYGIGFTRTGDWMNAYAHENAYHPFRDYLDTISDLPFNPMMPMFEKLLGTLVIDDHEDHAREFLRRWLTSVVAAVRGHGRAGMKGVLTFSGPQGIGKTSWFRNLFSPEMFCEGLVLDPHNKDTLIQATSHLVCELGELDATFKKDIPALKAFISNQSDKIRHPYAARSSMHPRRTVFCATVNQQNFLVDQTGNSRFWPISISDCDYAELLEMQASGEMHLLWREMDACYQACIVGKVDFKWWLGPEDMYMLNEVSEDFIRETPGETMLKDVYNMDGPSVHDVTAVELMTSLGMSVKDHSFAVRKGEVLEALRRLTGQRKRKHFRRDGEVLSGYKVPQRREKKMVAALSIVPTVPDIEIAPGGQFDINDFL